MGLDDMSYEELEKLKETRSKSLECMHKALAMLEEGTDTRALMYLQSYLSHPRVRAQNELLYLCGKTDVLIDASKLEDSKYVLELGKRLVTFLETLPYDIILQVAAHQTYSTSDHPLPQAALCSDQDKLELTLLRGIGD